MPDDGLKTFQQQIVLNEIERCIRLSYVSGLTGNAAFTQSWQGLVLLIDDYEGLPEDLKSQVYFRDRLTFSTRTPVPLMRAYLMKVHRWIDAQTQKVLHR